MNPMNGLDFSTETVLRLNQCDMSSGFFGIIGCGKSGDATSNNRDMIQLIHPFSLKLLSS